MVKEVDSSGSWVLWDSARNKFNLTDKYLLADEPDAEVTGGNPVIDLLSSGLKIRGTSGSTNTEDSTYIYMAFAEQPLATQEQKRWKPKLFNIMRKEKLGLSSGFAASSAVELRDLGYGTGTYWIKDNSGTAHQIYCDMNTAGGGWMSFAAAPGTGNWFTGNSGTTSWTGKNYSYGTYSTTGAIGSYWRNYSNQTVIG